MNKNGSDEHENSAESNVLSVVFSIVFLVWFVGSMIMMFVISKQADKGWKIGILIGQFFAVIGISATISEFVNKKIPNFLTAYLGAVGIGVVIISRKIHLAPLHESEKLVSYLPVSALAAFSGFGLMILLNTVVTNLSLKKRCTERVTAVVCEVMENTVFSNGSRRVSSLTPTVEMFINGENKRIELEQKSQAECPAVGDTIEMLVDPDDPESFLEASKMHIASASDIGITIAFIIIPLIMAAVVAHFTLK